MSTNIVINFENEEKLFEYLKSIGKDEKTLNFIKKRIDKFGFDSVKDLDFTKTKYKLAKEKVSIICNSHGEYKQNADNFLSGGGCFKCAIKKRAELKKVKGEKRFLKVSKSIHKNKYDYSSFIYINAKTKSIIKCLSCSKNFLQTPTNHLQGQGCPICGHIKAGKLQKDKIKKEFEERANKVHNNKYDYSLVDYLDSSTKVKIICPIHGEFLQTPNNHINKENGCKLCANDLLASTKTKPFQNLVKDLMERGKNNYIYNISNIKKLYKNNISSIPIKCKKCNNIFIQQINNHLQGQGCPKCKSSNGEKIIRDYLQENNIEFKEQKTFKECKYKGLLKFDFYLPQYNLCIEYDGIQHFKPIRFSNTVTEEKALQNFKEQKVKDKIKTDYCKNNNIELIRIKYNENIEEKLFFLLKRY